MTEKTEEFYVNFKKTLEETTSFPSNYLFKFIVPNEHKRLAEIHRIFDEVDPQFQSKESKNGKYASLTVNIYALDADQVIRYYKEAAKIPDIIML